MDGTRVILLLLKHTIGCVLALGIYCDNLRTQQAGKSYNFYTTALGIYWISSFLVWKRGDYPYQNITLLYIFRDVKQSHHENNF